MAALAGFAGKAVNGVISGTLMDDLWKLVVGHIDAHLMGNYNKRIGEKGRWRKSRWSSARPRRRDSRARDVELGRKL